MTQSQTEAVMQAAGARLRERDIDGARAIIDDAIAREPERQQLYAFAGLLACQAGALDAGVGHLRRALDLSPEDASVRRNLAFALVELGRLDEAGAVAASGDADDPRIARVLGVVHLDQDRHAEAAAALARVVAAFPGDFEAWTYLARARAVLGQNSAALAAFDRAIALRRDAAAPRLAAAELLAAAGRPEQQRRYLRDAVEAIPTDAVLRLALARTEMVFRDYVRAEEALCSAVTHDPTLAAAYVELGILYEKLSQIDALGDVIARADRNAVTDEGIDFLRAWKLKREGDFAAALALVGEACGETVDQVWRYQLLGQLHDRLGDQDRAFAAFERMNAESARGTPDEVRRDGALYLDEVQQNIAMLTPAAVAGWSPPVVIDTPPPPIFLAGFPRSGTTLLDTLLMGIPNVHVLEEQPMMRAVERTIGSLDRLPALDAAGIAALRDRYFEELYDIQPPPEGATVVDKVPLHMTRMATIHRLFPDAKIVFSERHPCDCLLSCYFSSFQPNRATTHYQTMEAAARLYDAAFTAWTRACEVLPLDVHVVRYERLVEDAEAEMRAVVDFLGLPWDPRALDNQATAAGRHAITTASYAQVTEPIYRRSAGRWQRYRDHMIEVLPILAPWAERMGYEM